MKASALIKRARSLADIENSQFISWDDEVNSLWEAWKDIYTKITNSSDDYFINELLLDTSSAISLGEGEWEIPLPEGSDVWKLRFVNYSSGGRWVSMSKFNTSARNRSRQPMYRWRGNSIWVVGSFLPGLIRIDYYPSPVKPTIPELKYPYALSYPRYELNKLTSMAFYAERNPNNSSITDYAMFVYSGNTLRLESYTMQSDVTIYTAAEDISNVRYHLGYVYFLEAGDIYRAPTLNGDTLAPVAITTAADIISFSIQSGIIYYAAATGTYSMELDGTAAEQLHVDAYQDYSIRGSDYYWLSAGTIWKNGEDTSVAALQLRSDGEALYWLDSLGQVVKQVGDDITAGQNVIHTSATYIGQPMYSYIPVTSAQLEQSAVSTVVDYEFTYPLNEANELMAYRCAIDFRRKQNGDLTDLTYRLMEIDSRLDTVLMRDAGLPERRVAEAATNWGIAY